MAHPTGPDDPIDLDLQRALGDAVADVEPRDRLGEIRRRTTPRPQRSSRLWALVLGAGVATAAVVGIGGWLGTVGLPGSGDGEPAGSPERHEVVATYFLADTPLGERLFREFRAVAPAADDEARVLAALRLLEQDEGPLDPDYRSGWPAGAFTGVEVSDGRVRVELSATVGVLPAAPVVQQAVLTAQAAVGETLPVAFSSPVATLGPDAGEGVARDNRLLAPANITDPVEGHEVDDLLTLRGTVANGVEGDVRWEVRDDQGVAVASGTVTPDDLAWEHTTGIAEVPPGTYLLVVAVDTDAGPAEDTRTVTVR
ncbi:immunoglobulin-like protein involved in spore germination [Nocardioides sp. J9]|uniref:Gmad2 immunoglobulin-like domain-containing protein n=1 Tax=unclassified Nocardioides TaxID=2615069 RepID=UPI00048F8310|nr:MULTISPECIES: Gmad2 immunoglobulin-like domain-containing protein [unclassified Nocardioides]TWG89987.1 immunoglobulin-like protein involved in spore germination [Nocardioides sp. J9]